MIRIKKGLDLPISGKPTQVIDEGRGVRSIALLGDDFPGMKPTMSVVVGDQVRKGQMLFSDKKIDGVVYTSPVAGAVTGINRGAKRAFISVVVEAGEGGEETFPAFAHEEIESLQRKDVVDQLLISGSWPALRTRPYSRVPAPNTVPNSIFVTAIDTNPLAADPKVVIAESEAAFSAGLSVLTKLTDGAVHLCQDDSQALAASTDITVLNHVFAGIHPAGLPGTHIHFIDPVGPNKTVWFVGYQDVIAFGHLFLSGRIYTDRVVSIAGRGAVKPRLVKTVMGANLDELTAGEVIDGEQRVISGSVLAGRTAKDLVSFLGRYHNQVSILPEDRERRLIGYLRPGANKHSVFPAFLSKWIGEKSVAFNTSTNGSSRGMVPIGTYDSVMPLDILATQLMRSLLVGDIEKAIELGCLELDEADIALCTYACPGKYEFGPVLRGLLSQIEKEG